MSLSGGQGSGEELAEGEALARYAAQKGVEKIIAEGKSTSENLLLPRELMGKGRPRFIAAEQESAALLRLRSRFAQTPLGTGPAPLGASRLSVFKI